MSTCRPTEEAKRDIRAMAKGLLAAGYVDHAEIVEKIHDLINTDEFPIWKSEIADIVEGFGSKDAPKETRDELAQKVQTMKRELKAMRESVDGQPKPADAARIDARKRALQAQIADTERRIKYGLDPKKRSSSVTTPAIENLKAQRDALKSKLEGGTVKNEAEKAALQRKLQDVTDKLAGKIKEQKPPEHRADDAGMTALKAKLANARAALEAKNLEASARTALQERIANLLQRLAGKDKPGAKAPGVDSPEVANLKRIRDKLQADLDALENPKKTADDRRQAAIQRQIDALRQRIADGDFAPRERPKPLYDSATLDAQAALNKERLRFDKLVRKAEYQQSNPVLKAFGMLLAIKRFCILSGSATLAKLSAAATLRIGLSPVENLIGTAFLRPLFPGVYAKSARFGGGFKDLLAGERAALSPESFKRTGTEIKSKWGGVSDLKAAFGHDLSTDHIPAVLELPGRIHGILKTPAEINEYFRSVSRASSVVRNRALKAGMTPAEAQAHVESTAQQAIIQAVAFEQSQRAVLMQDNAAAGWVKAVISIMGNAGKPGTVTRGVGRTAEWAANMELPIKKIPVNIFSEITSYLVGGAKAGAHGIAARGRPLTAHEADMVAMHLQKQVVGTALMTIGWMFYQSFGGYFHSGQKQEPGEPDAGDANIDGHAIDKKWLHTPAAEAIQVAADARRAYEAGVTAKVDKKGNVTKAADSIPAAAVRAAFVAAKDPMRDLSFVDSLARLYDAFKDPKSADLYLGSNIKDSFIPSPVQQYARSSDPETVRKRKPADWLDEIKLGIPGMREQVGFGDPVDLSFQQRMDAYQEMSPEDRASTGMLKHIKTAAKHHRKDMTADQRDQLRAILADQ